MNKTKSILIGNAFPMTLIRRPIQIAPQPLTALQHAADGAELCSFWGHENSRAAAEAFCGLLLRPETERRSITLNSEGFPILGSRAFSECWVLSPDYIDNFRPAIGQEVPQNKIRGWQILKLTWK